MNRRKFLYNVFRISGASGLLALGLSTKEANAVVVGYSRVFGGVSPTYLTDWDMTTTSLTEPSGATATLNTATQSASGLLVDGANEVPNIPWVSGTGVTAASGKIIFDYTQSATASASYGKFFAYSADENEFKLQKFQTTDSYIDLTINGTLVASWNSLVINVFDQSLHNMQLEWDSGAGIGGSFTARLTIDGTEVHTTTTAFTDPTFGAGGTLTFGNRDAGSRNINGTFKDFTCEDL